MATTLFAVMTAIPNYTCGLSPIWTTAAFLKLFLKMTPGTINPLLGSRTMSEKTVNYICTQCKTEELIPQSVIDFFNSVDPDPLFDRPPSFRCEKCGHPYMVPKDYLKKSTPWSFFLSPKLYFSFFIVSYTARKFLPTVGISSLLCRKGIFSS